MKKQIVALLMLGLFAGNAAAAKLKVFACEPEWGALVQELSLIHI